jgi:hypothetical protein
MVSDEFADRVLGRRVDLLAMIEEGLPELDYLQASHGMLLRGRRHLVAAPRKAGKSISMLSHLVRMAQAGARIVVLDRENGAVLYASRLDQIFASLDLDYEKRKAISNRLIYLDFPRLGLDDGEDLARFVTDETADLVVFDAQRMFLSDMGLKEDDSDDYARFMRSAVEPLFEAEIATLILDNTGHGTNSRSRGSSAKGDLNEVLFTLKVEEDFSEHKRGRVRLVLAPGASRFGNHGSWLMSIGDAHFGPWRQDDPAVGAPTSSAPNLERARALLLDQVRANPGASREAAVRACKGGGVGDQKLREALSALIDDGDVVLRGKGLHAAS